jgi:hypothetical protein
VAAPPFPGHTYRMGGRSFVFAGAVVGAAMLATGCDSRKTEPKPLAVVRESCATSWVPTAETFKGYEPLSRTSVRLGPITLMGTRVAARRDVAAYGSIKFRTLVHPRTAVTVEIGEAARSAVGFVAPADAERSIWPKHGAPLLRLEPCRANYPAVRGVLAVGYPMFLRVRHNACVPLTVGQTRRTVSIGAGRC